MKLNKQDSKLAVKEDYFDNKGNIETYSKFIDLFSASFIPKDSWLSEREIQLISCLCKSLKEYDDRYIYNKELMYDLFVNSFPDKRTIRIWVKRVKAKDWLMVSEDKKFYMNPILEAILKDDSRTINFNLDLNFEY